MKLKVNENCVGCGLCIGVCPRVFSMNDDGYAQAAEVEMDAALEAEAMEAMDGCPMQAIEEDDE